MKYALLVDVALLTYVLATLAGIGCVSGRPGAADVTAYAAEQQACVSAHDTRADIDACRTDARARWCAKWKDEVNCPARGGNQP